MMNKTPISNDQFTRTIDLDLDSLARLTEAIEAFGVSAGIPGNVIMELSLALEEIITNAIKYGYADRRQGDIEVTATVSPGMVKLAIGDDGDPFDPAMAPIPDLRSPIEDRAVGGLGLHLIRQLMDSFDYERKNGRNLITVTKRF